MSNFKATYNPHSFVLSKVPNRPPFFSPFPHLTPPRYKRILHVILPRRRPGNHLRHLRTSRRRSTLNNRRRTTRAPVAYILTTAPVLLIRTQLVRLIVPRTSLWCRATTFLVRRLATSFPELRRTPRYEDDRVCFLGAGE